MFNGENGKYGQNERMAFKMFLFALYYIRLPTRKYLKQGLMVSDLERRLFWGKPVRVWEADTGKGEKQRWAGCWAKSQQEKF